MAFYDHDQYDHRLIILMIIRTQPTAHPPPTQVPTDIDHPTVMALA